MAVKTRTPRTSSGSNKERKALRAARQEGRNDRNKAALKAMGGEHFLYKTKANGEEVTLRPSKALRRAERAKRFAQAQKSED